MITDVCKPRPNGYMGQVDCAEHGTPWPCDVTKETWAEYVKAMTEGDA